MKRGILLSIISAAAVLGMLTMANAGSVDWQYFTNAPDAGVGPGVDLLMGTSDDAADARNTAGAYSVASIVWDPVDPQCGPASVSYMTGIEVDCLGTPPGGFTATYLNVAQTETIPGAGTTQIKMTPGGGPNTGTPCGLGVFTGTKDTTIYSGGAPLMPLNDTPVNGKILSATVAVTQPYTCLSTTYSQAYLESVRGKLPGSATAFMVACGAISFGPLPIPCLNNAVSGSTVIAWTDDPLDCSSTCCDNDGDGYDGPQCAGDDCLDTNPNVNPGATEICGNGLDDDCVGGDEACAGACAGGVEE